MRKHQFVKEDCNCTRRATYFRCKFCGTMEYISAQELRALNSAQAECASPDAPAASPQEIFRGMLGGTFDCLAPDYATYHRNAASAGSGRTARDGMGAGD
ncbi:MAG: hypothetical protein LBC79_02845 [Deltaproteobacteria bacterium]|jgi:hypothetical protein|nr:hypothetical protein [Deltaproteobacteria bacterium]